MAQCASTAEDLQVKVAFFPISTYCVFGSSEIAIIILKQHQCVIELYYCYHFKVAINNNNIIIHCVLFKY